MSVEGLYTGWFGIPGKDNPRAKVHVYGSGSKACLCGWKPSTGLHFQWCANGAHWPYIECGRCKNVVIANAKRDLKVMEEGE